MACGDQRLARLTNKGLSKQDTAEETLRELTTDHV